MSNFLENIFDQLGRSGGRAVLCEIHGRSFVRVSGGELLRQVQKAREFLRSSGLRPGDRCGLLGANSIDWAALDLAIMAERLVVVPLYSRQAIEELAAMLRDSGARLLLTSDAALGAGVVSHAPQTRRVLFDEIFGAASALTQDPEAPESRGGDELVAIIYTSGTSGEPKGVCLTAGNLTHMLSVTTSWTDRLMGKTSEPIRVFQYLPFNFAASWMVLLSCLSRETTLTLSTDLNHIAEEIPLAAPNYFLNVPTLLERVRRSVAEALAKRPAFIRWLYARGRESFERRQNGAAGPLDALWLAICRKLIFSRILERFGPNLRALVCGSAPLSPETQQFFLMLGIPVLQAYGLTETTGISTMDDPEKPGEPGFVGQAIPGIEMKLGENQEILVRGPNIFARYWNRPEETARVLSEGWLHTGDQGEVSERGNWRITGRLKNLIILNSGHNIAPEPIEEKLAALIPEVQHVVLVGNGRGYLSALLTGRMNREAVEAALARLNRDLPHYRQIRDFTILPEPFTPESGLLTPNGKLRRDAINSRFAAQISAMYRERAAMSGAVR
jgi:long-chain acyl-CoA synthetase